MKTEFIEIDENEIKGKFSRPNKLTPILTILRSMENFLIKHLMLNSMEQFHCTTFEDL